MHIAIAGNIGSGKTTLTNMLAHHFGWTPRFEAVAHNPYLEDYYADIRRWSFNLEVFFLTQRFKDALAIRRSTETVIQDRSIFEGVYIFAANNYAMGNLTERDFQTYMDLFRLMTSLVGTPDLMIYLRSSVPHLVAQIQRRGRDYEQTMQLDYLKNLNDSYDDFIFHKYPGRVLVIDKDNLDYEHRPQDFASIVDKINAQLYGLFPETSDSLTSDWQINVPIPNPLSLIPPFIMHIAIAGNIGCGKTTLTKMLAKRYGWTPRFESVENNPYLADYYEDMARWSFNLQIYFLNKRFQDVVEISRCKETIVQDRTIFEDARIFAPNLHDMGLMSDRDFANYSELFDLMMSLVGKPDLLIYIRASIPHLIAQIQKRGREYEQGIRIDYLNGLNERYENWIGSYEGRLLVVDGDNLDFQNNPRDFQSITDQIDAELFGLFADNSDSV